jgi:hypothetical protein
MKEARTLALRALTLALKSTKGLAVGGHGTREIGIDGACRQVIAEGFKATVGHVGSC